MSAGIKLGYEIGTGKEVLIPLRHTAVTGQTQESGKTTTLEGIIQRSGGQRPDGTWKEPLQSVAFITKRGEKSFRLKTTIAPYFREPEITAATPMWEWIGSILEAAIDQKIGKEEQAAIIQASDRVLASHEEGSKKGPRRRLHSTQTKVTTLEHVHHNIELMVDQERGSFKRACICLDAYFKKVMPQIRKLKSSAELTLRPGINVMDLEDLTDEMQALIIRSVIETVYRSRKNTVIIVPESAKFIPNRRSSPVRFAAEMFIRQGLGIGNVLMLDSQDLANVATEVLKSVGVWILGKQTEINEVRRVVEYIPAAPKIPANNIQQLGRGEFYAVFGDQVRKVYVQPAGMEDVHAKSIALGEETADSWKAIERRLDKETPPDPALVRETEAELRGPSFSGNPAKPAGDAGQTSSGQRGVEDPHHIEGDGDSRGTPVVPDPLGLGSGSIIIARGEYDSLLSTIENLQDEIAELKRIMRGETEIEKSAPKHEAYVPPNFPPNGNAVKLDGNFAEFLASLRRHPEVIHLIAERPEIEITVERPVVDLNQKTIAGRAARLVADGFFTQAKTGSAAYNEMCRRGWGHDKRSVYRELDSLAEMGFVTKEPDGYQAVPEMRIKIREGK